MGSDTKIVTQKVLQIIGLANTIFAPLKLTLVISSIEIWSNKNKIPTVEQPHLTLFRFLEWRKDYLKYQSHHFAFLFALGKQHALLGASLPGKICDKEFAAGVALYPKRFSLESYTIIIVQLLGISLGLNYDSDDSCYCSGDVCAMMPKAIFSRGIKDFSTCSLDDFKSITSHSDAQCLSNSNYSPFEKPFYKQQNPQRVCGNNIIEQGEQCDCGTAANCTHKDCCDPRTCTKISGKDCGSGECCTKGCKVKPRGVLCRDVKDKQCDFPEYCNGESHICPRDTYTRNGEHCEDGDAFCYEGLCNTATKQCKKLIGGDTRGAPFPCYDEVNARGDRFGNCGRDPCNYPDLLCGKLVCIWPHKSFVLRTNLSVIYTHLYDEMCVSTYKPAARPQDQPTLTTYNTAQDRDETFVSDGTICGPNMICINFACRVVNSLHNTKLCEMSDHCGGNGICNNFNHCHCKKGFAPPNCTAKPGEFGSVDDGHFQAGGRSDIVGRHAVFKKKQLHLILYISLPVFIIVGAVLLKQNKIKEIWYRGDTESDGSDRSKTEESGSSISHDNLSPP
ncbi:disintegrin and metalloproteinase domain-containing protein 5-like [Ochotona curzoniae]|uniref:disintegrin and metalloproteinase domain-containing protein 5-like n=1 Tax=Ochotona curzoniae TaxID=130825 RepID=UPI001B34DF26|nr:disintegrin and metalloproteinase domain-containing protein 5-like [Ochotona curzoniae]